MSNNEQQTNDTNKWQQLDEENTQDVESSEQAETGEAVEGLEFPSHGELENQLTAAEQKAAECHEKMMMARAELENVRKRSERDVQNAHKFANEKLLAEMLPVMDSLTRALEGPAPSNEESQNMRKGIELTLDLLENSLKKGGVEVIAPDAGETFNPEQHEAMSMQPGTDQASNTVVQVLQKGYLLNGRVLRAAMVIVAQ